MYEVKRIYLEVDPMNREEDYRETVLESYLKDRWEPYAVRATDKFEDHFLKRMKPAVEEKKKPGRPAKNGSEKQ